MESKLLRPWWLLPISFLLFSSLQDWVHAKPQVPCYFIFGDSFSDSGNNNKLLTLAKVNYRPYGIDFPKGPTGRFSNGRNIQDIIEGKSILKGVNYASGSAGIRDETGMQLGVRIPMKEQIINHKTIISRISKILGNDSSTKKLLNQCIFSIYMGSNDYINNYFQPLFYKTSRQYTPDQYAAALIEQLSKQIKTLYDNGGRKFAVFRLGSLGCTPFATATFGTNGSLCVDKINNAITLFNDRSLLPLVKELNNNLTDARFCYLNPSPNPFDLSFVLNASCCKTGVVALCRRSSEPCSNRNRYVFWDGVHTADAWNEVVAKRAYQTNSTLEAYPSNIQKLATSMQ